MVESVCTTEKNGGSKSESNHFARARDRRLSNMPLLLEDRNSFYCKETKQIRDLVFFFVFFTQIKLASQSTVKVLMSSCQMTATDMQQNVNINMHQQQLILKKIRFVFLVPNSSDCSKFSLHKKNSVPNWSETGTVLHDNLHDCYHHTH